MFNEDPEAYESYKRAAEAIARARATEGVTEGGMLRTAIVESAAALTEALFELAGSVGGSAFNDEQEFFYRLSSLDDIAKAIEKLAPAD
jgi:hypothetical protein